MCFAQLLVYVLRSMITSKRQRSLEPLAAWMFSHSAACEELRPDCAQRWLCCARGASYNPLFFALFLIEYAALARCRESTISHLHCVRLWFAAAKRWFAGNKR